MKPEYNTINIILCTGTFITELPMTNDLLKNFKLAHLKDTATLEQKKSKLKKGRKLKLEEIADIKGKKERWNLAYEVWKATLQSRDAE